MFARMQCIELKRLAATLRHDTHMACQSASSSTPMLPNAKTVRRHGILAEHVNKQQRHITDIAQGHDQTHAIPVTMQVGLDTTCNISA